MELQIRKQNLSINEMVFDSQCEQPLECDLVLPDYCPDIQRILHCDVTCHIRDSHAEAQRLTLEGELRLNILYVSDSGMLRGIDHKQSFVRQLDSKKELRQPMVEVQCKQDYLNCRAISSRRLEVRGALTLRVRAINCAQNELLHDAEGAGIQLKKQSVEMDSCIGGSESAFTLREELDLGNEPPIAQILSSRAQAVVTDCKLLSGRIITKGELHLQLLYLPLTSNEKDAPRELSYTLPVSQVVNADGADEQSHCCVRYQLCGWELQPKADMDGEMKQLSVEVQLKALAAVHVPQTAELVQDAYSTQYPLNFEEKNLSYLNFVRCLQESHRLREVLSVNGSVQSILSAWVSVKELQSNQNDEGILVSGSLALCVLYLDEENCPQLTQEVLKMEHSIPMSEGQKGLLFGLKLSPTSVEATLNASGQPELRCQLLLEGSLYSTEHQSAISALSLDESSGKQCACDCALCIYYADAKESIWDIAKKYNSSVSGIMEENGLDHDILPQRTMLLIPMF